ncbi:MAG: TfoX/Sxy family protein [Planctomycetes bacterium]|nr:TfoX/Sxy family protein [Planctomycetota bacterium]
MSYDEIAAERVREILAQRKGFVEKKMFGGVGFLLSGNMCVGVWKEFLIVRVGEGNYENALKEEYAKEFDITGRAMKGWVMVGLDGFHENEDLLRWIEMAVRFVKTLPAKSW